MEESLSPESRRTGHNSRSYHLNRVFLAYIALNDVQLMGNAHAVSAGTRR